MKDKIPVRNLLFVVLGILVLLFKRRYAGPFAALVNNHGSNFSVSFAVYFIAVMGFNSFPRPKLFAVVGSFLAVELFELSNGFFGLMGNVYDPWDYLANALGIGLGLGIDLLINRFSAE